MMGKTKCRSTNSKCHWKPRYRGQNTSPIPQRKTKLWVMHLEWSSSIKTNSIGRSDTPSTASFVNAHEAKGLWTIKDCSVRIHNDVEAEVCAQGVNGINKTNPISTRIIPSQYWKQSSSTTLTVLLAIDSAMFTDFLHNNPSLASPLPRWAMWILKSLSHDRQSAWWDIRCAL